MNRWIRKARERRNINRLFNKTYGKSHGLDGVKTASGTSRNSTYFVKQVAARRRRNKAARIARRRNRAH